MAETQSQATCCPDDTAKMRARLCLQKALQMALTEKVALHRRTFGTVGGGWTAWSAMLRCTSPPPRSRATQLTAMS